MYDLFPHCAYVIIQVLVEGRANSRAAILNRPSTLNALDNAMVCIVHIPLVQSRFLFRKKNE